MVLGDGRNSLRLEIFLIRQSIHRAVIGTSLGAPEVEPEVWYIIKIWSPSIIFGKGPTGVSLDADLERSPLAENVGIVLS